MTENDPNIKPKNKLLVYVVIIVMILAAVGGIAAFHYLYKPAKKVETITIAAPVYYTSSATWTNYLNNVSKAWEASHPNVKIKFVGPSSASSESQYYSKLNLLTSSKSTAPTVMLEDMFYTATYSHSGVLAPLNSYVNSSYTSNIQSSALGQMTINHTIYGLPATVTDTLIYYNTSILKEAGIHTPWNPKNWTDIINAAEKINNTLGSKGVVPLNIYQGVKADEASSFTGFETMLYGTGHGLYNFSNSKWYGNNPGLNATLGFYKTVFSKGYAQASISHTPYVTVGQYMKQGKLGIAIDGSWMYGYQWAPHGQNPISNFSKYIGVTAVPTEFGQAPYNTTMVGGWGWAMYNGIPNSEKPIVASFMKTLDNTTNQIIINLPGGALAGGLPPAKNAVNNSLFTKLMPTDPSLDTFFAGLLKNGHYRPPVATYPKISYILQKAMSNVVGGGDSVSTALTIYSKDINTTLGSGSVSPSIAALNAQNLNYKQYNGNSFALMSALETYVNYNLYNLLLW